MSVMEQSTSEKTLPNTVAEAAKLIAMMDARGAVEDEPIGEAEEEFDDEEVEADAALDDEDEFDDEEAEDADEEALFEYKADGQMHSVPLDELTRLASAGHNYNHKSNALAAERQKWEAEEVAAIRQEREQYAVMLPKLQEMIAAEKAALNDLRDSDPAAWAVKREQIREREEALAAEQARVNAAQQADQDKQLQRILEDQNAKLLEKVPGWKDPSVRQKEWGDMVVQAEQQYGLAPEVVNSILDHTLILILRDALAFQDVGKRKDKLVQKANRKTSQPGSATRTRARKTKRVQQLESRLRESGSVMDAAAILEERARERRK